MPHARRESFVFNKWPIEAFIHDEQTLHYFCEEFDIKNNQPIMPTMLAEAVCVAGNPSFVEPIQMYARELLKRGPKPFSPEEMNRARYMITDSIDDIRQPKGIAELQASATVLYVELSDFFFRSRNLWCARRKAIPRIMREVDPKFAERFIEVFSKLFLGETKPVIELAEELLSPHGGFLFDGYSADAPENFRKC